MTAQFGGDPTTFDPAAGVNNDDWTASQLLFDRLLRRDEDGSLIGSLASEWKAESASKYVLTIRDDATCADAAPITAEVVANSLQYYVDSKGPGATITFGPGAPTITADPSASTVTVQTATPYSDLLVGLTLSQSGIICPAGLDDPEGLKSGTVEGAFSGPYTLEESKPGVKYTFALRGDYEAWPEFAEPLTGTPAEKVSFGLLTDESTSVNMALGGDLDLVAVSGSQLERFDSSDYNILSSVAGNFFILFNERPGNYFADPARRRAVAQAIDREAWNKIQSDGRNRLFTTVVPSTYECAVTDESLLVETDPAAAAEVLEGGAIRIRNANVFGAQDRDSEYIQQVLENAGAKVDLKVEDLASWIAAVNDPEAWDMTIFGDGNNTGAIGSTLTRMMGPTPDQGGRNLGGVSNPAGAAAIEKALEITEPELRCAEYATAQETLLERVDAIPLAGSERNWPLPKDMKIKITGGAFPDYATIRLTD